MSVRSPAGYVPLFVLCVLLAHLPAWAATQVGNLVTATAPSDAGCPVPSQSQTVPRIGGPCTGFSIGYDSDPSSAEGSYLKNYHNRHCAVDATGILKCYWKTAKTACDAYVAMKESLTTDPALKPLKSNYVELKDGDLQCQYCFKGQNPVNGQCPNTGTNTYYRKSLEPAGYCANPVEGPYKNCPDTFTCKSTYQTGQPGFGFTITQTAMVLRTNKKRYATELRNLGNVVKSDLAGYPYPKPANQECIEKVDPADPNSQCKEPTVLLDSGSKQNSANVQHVIPKKDIWGCRCGANSMKNAIVISRQLNQHFLNLDRPSAQLSKVEELGMNPYMCVP